MPLASPAPASKTCALGLLALRITFLALTVFLATRELAHAQSEVASAERVLFDDLNRERKVQGLPALQWDEALAAAARAHAAQMAQRKQLSHQLPGEPPVQIRATQTGARFSEIAENIAVAPTPAVIHAAWMQSPHHRENILDPELTVVGIAVVKGSDGLYAVQDFSQAVANLDFDQQEQTIIANIKARGFASTKATHDARRTCDMDRGYSGSRPVSVVRFEAADLSKLPSDLEQKLRSGKVHSAAVGACQGGESAGFTRFRIAVMLY
jgi:uncharacterized protein YkwD